MCRIVMLLGMPRAATTFLYHHFDCHPDIFVPYKRKTNYFSLHFDSRPPNWFFEHFDAATNNQVCIDTETIGFVDKQIDVLDRIEQILGSDSRFILCVREPVEWLYSLYNQIRTFQKDLLPFEDFISGRYALREDSVTIPMNYQNGDIKDRISEIIERFGERLLLIDYKEIQKDPNQVLVKIEQFLNIGAYYRENPVSPRKINASDRKNIRFFTHMMRNPLLIRMASYLPVHLVKRARKLYDKSGAGSREGALDPTREKNVALARARFDTDVRYYRQLFPVEN